MGATDTSPLPSIGTGFHIATVARSVVRALCDHDRPMQIAEIAAYLRTRWCDRVTDGEVGQAVHHLANRGHCAFGADGALDNVTRDADGKRMRATEPKPDPWEWQWYTPKPTGGR